MRSLAKIADGRDDLGAAVLEALSFMRVARKGAPDSSPEVDRIWVEACRLRGVTPEGARRAGWRYVSETIGDAPWHPTPAQFIETALLECDRADIERKLAATTQRETELRLSRDAEVRAALVARGIDPDAVLPPSEAAAALENGAALALLGVAQEAPTEEA